MSVSVEEQIDRLIRQRDGARQTVLSIVRDIESLRADLGGAIFGDQFHGHVMWCENCGLPARSLAYQANRGIAVCRRCVLPTDSVQPTT